MTHIGRFHVRTRNLVLIGVALSAVLTAVLLSHLTRLTPRVRQEIVAALQERFDAEVELGGFQVSIFPRPEMWGEDLVIRYQGRRDIAPLVNVRSFSAAASIIGLVGRPLHLRSVTLEGLTVNVPRGMDGDVTGQTDSGIPGSPRGRMAPPPENRRRIFRRRDTPLIIDTIVATNASLEIPSKKAGKLPRTFAIHDLVMSDFAFDRPATFKASLTNPKPTGQIAVEGRFGPWLRDAPRSTALDGRYVFDNANLDTIKGIGGMLSSTGEFAGVLERLTVKGTTHTTDFLVDRAGQPVDLDATFEAVVDGTSGDTWLTPVRATFLDTEVIASGAVVRAEDVKGRVIALDVEITDGRIEDVMKLAIASPKPPLVGSVAVKAKMKLPPGDIDVSRRLELDGRFSLAEATFTNYNVQQKINTLSRKGRGQADDAAGQSVVAGLGGNFVLKRGTLSLDNLAFRVPGATVQLAGSYGLDSQMMDFRGDLLLDARLSETTSGFKAVLATIAQPLFRRPGGGSKLPIRVSGSRKNPSFGLDVKRALLPGR